MIPSFPLFFEVLCGDDCTSVEESLPAFLLYRAKLEKKRMGTGCFVITQNNLVNRLNFQFKRKLKTLNGV